MFLKIFSASMIAIALTTTVAEPAAKDKRRDTSAEWSHKAKWKPKPKKANTLPDWSKLSEAQRSQYRSEARKYCQEKFGGSIQRVQLLQGKILCWVYQ
jgi:hypothetical protein